MELMAQSPLKVYSYREMVKAFVKRYKTNKDASEDRKKGMIGELLVRVILELEGRFLTASPFFNMEKRSFKKEYDVALFETATNELWIAEVKFGNIQKRQKNASSAIVRRINTAKRKDLICQYRYADIREKRQTVYPSDLKELWERVQHHTKYYDEFVVLLEREGCKKYD